ncbi:MAG: hypothetical protein HYV28_13070 [Ignavibacteriales bacterium]|nr:hypothetical protein [Ignavibacteriales bacterium]
MKKRKYDSDKILSQLDEKIDVEFDPFLASKVLHLHKMQAKSKVINSGFRVTLAGFAILLLLFMNGFSLLKEYQSVSQSSEARLATVKQLSAAYFSNNE